MSHLVTVDRGISQSGANPMVTAATSKVVVALSACSGKGQRCAGDAFEEFEHNGGSRCRNGLCSAAGLLA